MGAAKKVNSVKSEKTTKTKTTKKLSLVTGTTEQQSFEFTFESSSKNKVVQNRTATEITEVSNVVQLRPVTTKPSGLEFEGQWNEEEVLAAKLFEKFYKFKVQESTSAKFAKSSVASTYINDQTVEEYIPWAIMKGVEKWRQYKMIKEMNALTAPMPENVTEMYHAKMKREARIKEILRYFEVEVDKQSSLMEFTEFNQIWNYCFTTFKSKIRNVYRDTVKAKNNDEYIDYNTVEDCLELNADYSEHFVKDDSRSIASREVLSILSDKVSKLNPAKKDLYLSVFKTHYIEDRDLAETCSVLKIARHTCAEVKKDIDRVVSAMSDSYSDYLEAA